MSIDVHSIRSEFPILHRKVNGNPLLYLDNAATTQKPQAVLDASQHYYTHINSNIHRGTHLLAREATEAFEHSRTQIAQHLNASKSAEIIFTAGTTESINLVAQIIQLSGEIKPHHRILISELEHHSNIVPWQMLCARTGATLDVTPITDAGEWDMQAAEELITEHTKIIALSHISNALGTINPIQKLISTARDKSNAYILIDGAQSVAHQAIDVQQLDCDFFVFSGHKIYAPTGIGVLYGKERVLDSLPPWQGGGEMIKEVSFSGTTYNELPFKYEAGTPNIEGAIALAEALKWVQNIGISNISSHEDMLLKRATQQLQEFHDLTIYGTSSNKASVLSFNLKGIHHYDVGTLLDQMGIAIRTGHHCCQPLMARYNINGTIRASFALYNTTEEVDHFIQALHKAKSMLA